MGWLAENVITVKCIVKALISALSRSCCLVAWSWYLPRLSHSGESVTHSPKVILQHPHDSYCLFVWCMAFYWITVMVFFKQQGKRVRVNRRFADPGQPQLFLFPSIPGYCMQTEDVRVTAKHRGMTWSFMCKTDTEVMEAWIIHPLHTRSTLANQAS